jgi:hypothetical protein
VSLWTEKTCLTVLLDDKDIVTSRQVLPRSNSSLQV